MDKLDKLLDFLENNIDVEHYELVEKIHLNTIEFKKVPFLPLTITCEINEEVLYPYYETFNDPKKMLYNELIQTKGGSVYSSVKIKDFFPLQIRSNHGIGIIASMFGAKTTITHNNMPWVEPNRDKNMINKILLKGVPDFSNGLGKQVINTIEYFQNKLKDFPKCAKVIKITQPDMQGPFDILNLLLGEDIFYLLTDDPIIIKALLELITETCILYMKFIKKYISDSANNDSVYVHGGIYKGKYLIKDDTAMTMLSPKMYREFAWQYNKKILDKYGGSIHTCGKVHDWFYDIVSGYANLHGINYGNPEMQDFINIYNKNIKNKMAIIGWGRDQKISFLEEIAKNKIRTGITLTCMAKNIKEAKAIKDSFLKNYMSQIS